jgi:hypothetical protein
MSATLGLAGRHEQPFMDKENAIFQHFMPVFT